MNAVEREPVPTRVLNPNVSEASYKPKERNYRKMKLTFFFFSGGYFPGDFYLEPFEGFISRHVASSLLYTTTQRPGGMVRCIPFFPAYCSYNKL